MGRHMKVEDKKIRKGEKAGLGVAHKKGQKKKRIVSVKGQMRSLQRLLNKEGLHPKLQQVEETKLTALRQKHEQHKQNERDRQLAKRYHMAKFFERRKIERKIEKAKREVAAEDCTPDAKAAAVEKLAEYEGDLEYVMHFPKGEKFVSLLKDAATPEAQARLDAERTRLRGLVRRQLADERLLSEVNEGRQDIPPGTAAQGREISAQAAAQRLVISTVATSVSIKGKTAPRGKVEVVTAEALRPPEGNMAEEDDFFMQSGDEANGKAQLIRPQASPDVRQRLEKATAARPREPGTWNKPKAGKKQFGLAPPRTFQKSREIKTEPQKEEAASRSRAEGGRKRKKKPK